MIAFHLCFLRLIPRNYSTRGLCLGIVSLAKATQNPENRREQHDHHEKTHCCRIDGSHPHPQSRRSRHGTEMPFGFIHANSYKGSPLEVRECSDLIVGPSGAEYTVTFSFPDIVPVEQVLTFWTIVAKAERTAEIITYNGTGKCRTMTLTVGSSTPIVLLDFSGENSVNLTEYRRR